MNYPFPQTDRKLAQKQLNYLGYTTDEVYLRFFYHSDNPKKNDDKGRKLNTLDWNAIANYQQDERGVYVVVNGGGHEDKDVTQCAAIFCEWDDRPIEDQLLHWETVGFVEPTFTVYSGDKSAQPYWVFDTPIEPEKWRELQRLLIEVMGADPSNKNPSRVFRLAGGWHVKPGREPRKTEIVQESRQKYSYQALKSKLESLVERKPPAPLAIRYEDITSPVPYPVPIEVCLAKESRSLLESGTSQGGRNSNGAKLARDLIGVANYLQTIGQSLDGEPRLLLEDYAMRCTPPLPTSEIESIWESANKSNPAPSCKSDGVNNCIRAWYWKTHLKNNSDFSMNAGLRTNPVSKGFATNNTTSNPNKLPLCDRITKILHRYDTESAQTAALMDLAEEVRKPFSDIKNLVRIIRSEGDGASEVVATMESFTPIIKNCRKRLDLGRYLNPILAKAINAKAQAMPTAPEYLFNTLLPACASRIGTSARVVVNAGGGYTQDLVFWTANVAHSGQAKTPPQKEVISPLEKMEGEAKDIYDASLADYEQDKKAEGKPPVRRRRLLSNVTTSTKIRIHEENPRGLLEYIDELVADYQRLNQYKGGGKGDDLQLELSFFNGAACNYDRQDARLFLRRTAFNKTGTYQWDTLNRLMVDDINFISSGYSARFLYCSILDAPPRYLDLLSFKPESNFTETLEWLYEKLEELPTQDYLLCQEAKVLFQAWNHTLADDEREENHFAFSLVYPKIEAYTARLALWLHIVNAVLGSKLPEPIISGETMQHAVEIASFYLWQQKLIHANNAPSRRLEGIFFKVQTQAEKFFTKSGLGLNASFLKTRINALKGWAVEKIRTVVFTALAKGGHGRIEGEGSEMKYIPFPPPSELVGVGGELVQSPIDESNQPKVFQPRVGEIGEIGEVISQMPKTIVGNFIVQKVSAINSETTDNHQFTNLIDNNLVEPSFDSIGGSTNSPPTAPTPSNSCSTHQELAALIVQCQTWVEIADSLQKNSQKLIEVMNQSNKDQRKKVAALLIDFLCLESNHLKELTWLPIKMLNWIFERLQFTVSRIGGYSIDDARLEQLENLSFVSVEGLGSPRELWIFRNNSSGSNIPVHGTEAICAISVKN